MDLEKNFEIAVAAIEKLGQLHAQFMKSIEALASPKIEGAELLVADGELRAVCLGVSLQTTHRPVARNGHLKSIEYAFCTKHGEDDVVVCTMYLEPNGDLYADSLAQEQICQSGNSYLTHRLAPWLARSLLQSQVFAPAK